MKLLASHRLIKIRNPTCVIDHRWFYCKRITEGSGGRSLSAYLRARNHDGLSHSGDHEGRSVHRVHDTSRLSSLRGPRLAHCGGAQYLHESSDVKSHDRRDEQPNHRDECKVRQSQGARDALESRPQGGDPQRGEQHHGRSGQANAEDTSRAQTPLPRDRARSRVQWLCQDLPRSDAPHSSHHCEATSERGLHEAHP